MSSPKSLPGSPIEITATQLEHVRKLYAKDHTDLEFSYFMEFALARGLNPFIKQVYSMKFGGVQSIITGIDGLRAIAGRSGRHAGTDEATFDTDSKGNVISSKCTVHVLLPNGSKGAFSARVWMSEYSTKRGLWKNKPRTMLAKVAESHALRKAFPEQMGQLYTPEEMDQARVSRNPKPVVSVDNSNAKNNLIEAIRKRLAVAAKDYTLSEKKALIQAYTGSDDFGALYRMDVEKLKNIHSQPVPPIKREEPEKIKTPSAKNASFTLPLGGENE